MHVTSQIQLKLSSTVYINCLIETFWWTIWNRKINWIYILINSLYMTYIYIQTISFILQFLETLISKRLFIIIIIIFIYLSRIPTSPKCFSVGSCNFKLQYINSIFSHVLFTATHIYNIIIYCKSINKVWFPIETKHNALPWTSRSHQHWGGGGCRQCFDQHFLGFWRGRKNFSRKCCRRGGGGKGGGSKKFSGLI